MSKFLSTTLNGPDADRIPAVATLLAQLPSDDVKHGPQVAGVLGQAMPPQWPCQRRTILPRSWSRQPWPLQRGLASEGGGRWSVPCRRRL